MKTRSVSAGLAWTLSLVATTAIVGIPAYVYLCYSGKPSQGLREILETALGGEIGLLGGILLRRRCL